MSHPLDGAVQRLQRADEHLRDLKGEIDRFLGSKNRLVLRARVLGVSARSPLDEMPGRLSILIGEVVYNLRGALDCLVYGLAEVDFRRPVVGIRFPIDDHSNTFSRRKRNFRQRLSPTHVADIELLQPFRGCEWTRRLRALSDIDKHRHLFLAKRNASGPPSEVYLAFDDKSPVVETLEKLKLDVARTLEGFLMRNTNPPGFKLTHYQ